MASAGRAPELVHSELESLQRIPAVVIDAAGRLVFYTRAFEELVGQDPAPRVGKRPPHPWWPREEVGRSGGWLGFLLSGAAARSRVRHTRTHVTRPDGTRVAVTAEYQPLLGENDRPVRHLLAFTNEPSAEGREGEDERRAVERAVLELRRSVDRLADRLGIADPEPDRAGRPELSALSRREREVLEHLLLGLTPAEIGKRLFISRHTVRNHTGAIYRKLGVRSQVELVRRFGGPPS